MELTIPRFFNPPSRSYFLFGPRGTGKSTYLKAAYQEAVYIDLLKSDVQRRYHSRPETIIELVRANSSVRTLRPKGPLDSPHEIDGAALEGLVFQHLKAWNDYMNNPFDIYFWRSRAGTEVDFILYGEPGIYGIEMKNSNRILPADLRALSEFKKDYPMSENILLYRGPERLLKENILCIPCEHFRRSLKPGIAF